MKFENTWISFLMRTEDEKWNNFLTFSRMNLVDLDIRFHHYEMRRMQFHLKRIYIGLNKHQHVVGNCELNLRNVSYWRIQNSILVYNLFWINTRITSWFSSLSFQILNLLQTIGDLKFTTNSIIIMNQGNQSKGAHPQSSLTPRSTRIPHHHQYGHGSSRTITVWPLVRKENSENLPYDFSGKNMWIH